MNDLTPFSAIKALPADQRAEYWSSLTVAEKQDVIYNWKRHARPEQLAPGGVWHTWLVLAGRGFGKTRMGTEWVRGLVEGPSPLIAPPRAPQKVGLIGSTAHDVRAVMVEGESGVLECSHNDYRPRYRSSLKRIQWANGIEAHVYSADEPDQLRGPQHGAAWADEVAKWKYPKLAWDNLEFGLRLGVDPRICATTTPRPIKLLKELIDDPRTITVRGSTFDNAENLPEGFLAQLRDKYEGTRIGRQELHAELLTDVPGALWLRDKIDETRVKTTPDLVKIVVAVDPPVSTGENADECGIIVAGIDEDRQAYILADVSAQGLSPAGWAKVATDAYERYKADRIVAEVNQGGDLVENVIRQVAPNVSYRAVHATRGKVVRAEPVAALYEQSKVHHVGSHGKLEDQMCEFTTDFNKTQMGYSPDRVDSLVWALTDLMLGKNREPRIRKL